MDFLEQFFPDSVTFPGLVVAVTILLFLLKSWCHQRAKLALARAQALENASSGLGNAVILLLVVAFLYISVGTKGFEVAAGNGKASVTIVERSANAGAPEPAVKSQASAKPKPAGKPTQSGQAKTRNAFERFLDYLTR